MRGSAEQSNSNAMFVIVLAMMIMLFLYLPEHFQTNFYLNIWRIAKLWELQLFNNTIGPFLPSFISEAPALYELRLEHLERPDITYAHIYDVERMTMARYGFVFPIILAVYAWRTIKLKSECRGMLTLEDLIRVQAQNFPFIKHNIVHNPLDDPRLDVTRGKYAMRIKPLEFAKREGMITLDTSVTDREEQRYFFNEEVFIEYGLKSMGSRFTGFDDLRKEESWMMASFLIFLHGDLDAYYELLGRFSEVHYYLVKNPETGQKLSDKVDANCAKIIQRFANPSPLQNDLKSVLNDSSYGDDVTVVAREIMSVLRKHDGIGTPSSLLGEHFKEEYKALHAKEYVSPGDYIAFEKADYLPMHYKAFLATGMLWTMGDEQKLRALHLTKRFLSLLSIDTLSHEEELELESIENDFVVTIISNLEINASDILKDAIRKHAYTHGVLLRLYTECGALGVITANRFNWLQLVNKKLFLLLDDGGMPEGSAEVTFSRAHYDQEIKAGRKLRKAETSQQIEEFKKRLLERVRIV